MKLDHLPVTWLGDKDQLDQLLRPPQLHFLFWMSTPFSLQMQAAFT